MTCNYKISPSHANFLITREREKERDGGLCVLELNTYNMHNNLHFPSFIYSTLYVRYAIKYSFVSVFVVIMLLFHMDGF